MKRREEMNRRYASRGFTLIELLVVIVIMGIIIALVAYSTTKMMPNLQIAAASQQVLGAVGQARSTAVTKSAIVQLRLYHNAGTQDSFAILMRNPADTMTGGGGTYYRVGGALLNNGIEFYNLPSNPANYQFLRDGSLDFGPIAAGSRPVIRCINKTSVQRTLYVMRATGIAELKAN